MGLCITPLAAAAPGHWHRSCPLAESLVPGSTWHTHKLAPGVTLSEAEKTDDNGRGLVKMHVLRVTIGQPGVSFQPLMRAVAQRTPLSQLASGHAHLVAAVNTGYFDFQLGAPTQPLIVRGQPLVLSARRQPVLGFASSGALQYGSVYLAGTVHSGATSRSIAGVNEVSRTSGLEEYDSAWGDKPVPSISWSPRARDVVAGKLGGIVSRDVHVPHGGYTLMADGQSAAQWLSSLPSGAKTALAEQVRSTTKQPFAQAYGVGAEIVQRHGQTRSDLSCNSANTMQPARTAYGIADNGKTLVIGEVEDHPGTNVHGLDANQMSGFMAQLGVDRAWDVDGSGSTELLAKLATSSSLSLRTYPADGQERPMPVGLGISYVKPKIVRHKHRTQR
jgi:hypothetical protein